MPGIRDCGNIHSDTKLVTEEVVMTTECNLRSKLLSSSSGGRLCKQLLGLPISTAFLVKWGKLHCGLSLLATWLLLSSLQTPRTLVLLFILSQKLHLGRAVSPSM